MLRSYSAVHGMSATVHAVVEVSADEILLRAGPHWTRFKHAEVTSDTAPPSIFVINEDGSVRVGDVVEEMDMAAERIAREMLHNRRSMLEQGSLRT